MNFIVFFKVYLFFSTVSTGLKSFMYHRVRVKRPKCSAEATHSMICSYYDINSCNAAAENQSRRGEKTRDLYAFRLLLPRWSETDLTLCSSNTDMTHSPRSFFPPLFFSLSEGIMKRVGSCSVIIRWQLVSTRCELDWCKDRTGTNVDMLRDLLMAARGIRLPVAVKQGLMKH